MIYQNLLFSVGVMVKDIFQELRLDVPSIEKHITPNMLCLRDLEVMLLIEREREKSSLKFPLKYQCKANFCCGLSKIMSFYSFHTIHTEIWEFDIKV